MEVTVDQGRCQGYGQASKEVVPPELAPDVVRAVANCPELAITTRN